MAGVFFTPEEFFGEARKATHPLDLDGAIPDELVLVLKTMLEVTPEQYVRRLATNARELIKLVADNRVEDDLIISNMHPRLAAVMKTKRFASMKALANKIGYPDRTVVDEAVCGFKIVGIVPFTHSFGYELNIPEVTVEVLRSNSHTNNAATLDRCKTAVCEGFTSADERGFWEQCLDEVSNNWLAGPFSTVDEVSNAIGEVPHLCHRFPLMQKGKIRPIDNLKDSGVNAAYGNHDK